MEDRPVSGNAPATLPKRRAVIASVLSFAVPGLGQAFNGDLKKAVLWGLTVPFVIFIGSPLRIRATFIGFGVLWLIQWITMVLSATEAYRSARIQMDASGISWLQTVATAALAGALIGAMDYAAISSATIRMYKISASSMTPTIVPGERVAVDVHYYKHRMPHNDDVVMIKSPDGPFYVKRIAAVGGQVIEGKEGRIVVDGKPFEDRFAVDPRGIGKAIEEISTFGPETVPPGKFFVLGDNRGHSWDSRSPGFGLLDRTDINGKVLYVYWSKDIREIGRNVR